MNLPPVSSRLCDGRYSVGMRCEWFDVPFRPIRASFNEQNIKDIHFKGLNSFFGKLNMFVGMCVDLLV